MKTIKTITSRIFRSKVLSPMCMACAMTPLAFGGSTLGMVAVAVNLFATLVCILSPVSE